MCVNKNGGKWLHPALSSLLGACLLCTDEVALRLDDAPALDNNVVAQDPLQPPVTDVQVLRSRPHRLLKRVCRYQLWKKRNQCKEGAV